LSALAELCCDEAVGQALGGSTASYRRTLLRLARPMFAPGPFGSLAFFCRRSQLIVRIECLDRQELRRDGGGHRNRPVLRRALAGALCLLVLLGSTPPARPRAAESEVSPSLESLQGCLQLRYAVQAALARQASNPPPGP
jgi:hypothetical protein